jgi:hypothetical protein
LFVATLATPATLEFPEAKSRGPERVLRISAAALHPPERADNRMRYGAVGQKSLPFVETHGFQVDANLLGEAANPERLCIGSHYHKTSLNPVVWSRVKPF